MNAIVHSLEPITLIGGAPCHDSEIRSATMLAPKVVAADGGAERALAFGVVPQAVIGDMDSIGSRARSQIGFDRIFTIDEQDSTDFDKALGQIDAPLAIGVGFSGGRMDHQLAVFNAMVRHATRPCVVAGARELVFLAPPEMELGLEIGTVVSLFPMGQVQGTSAGLKWAIDGITFAPDGRIGTSNQVTGPVRLIFDQPRMLVILPVAVLDHVVMQLLNGQSKWPAL